MKDYTRRGCTVPIDIETTTELIRQVGHYKDLAQSLADALEEIDKYSADMNHPAAKIARAALANYRKGE